MIQAFFLSLGQLLDGRVAMVFLKSLLITLVLFAGLGIGLYYGIHWAAARWLNGYSGPFADIAVIVLLLAAHWLLFRAIAIGVIGIFADEVVAAVEAKYYPGAHADARDVPFARSLAMGLGSGIRIILINLALSPIYIALLITGVGTAVAFFIVNSWLLGRDLGDMVAARHMKYRDLPRWRSRTSLRRFILGMFGTGILLIPVVALVGPVLGAAMATHAFHRGRRA
ncbi:MAG: EI24 domain-containing protein [Sphingomonas sp.]|uniref:EI24 domain-containing protein n=1 Tax=Sphingomonas sp. TaxID=28214 RepID=UPI0025FDA159|nr:EI24 domain-containing protein [Sphingomonas sp.]MBX3566246.1 EI24 domain-containing protein [Sphingomonas sp.]